MINFEEQFRKKRDELRSQFYPSVATRVMKKQIEMGLLPKEFLNYLVKYKKDLQAHQKARLRFRGKFNLKNLIINRDKRCVLCFSEVNLEVDHIKPLLTHPELALEVDNLRTLCRKCNRKKGSRPK